LPLILNSKVHLLFLIFNLLIFFYRVDAERELQEISERIVVVLSVAGFLHTTAGKFSVWACGVSDILAVLNKLSKLDKSKSWVGSVELGLELTSFFGHVEKNNKKKEKKEKKRERENLDCKINMFFWFSLCTFS